LSLQTNCNPAEKIGKTSKFNIPGAKRPPCSDYSVFIFWNCIVCTTLDHPLTAPALTLPYSWNYHPTNIFTGHYSR
jgi:hypothetical protein